jgi:uncharacterized delta-60 repeat protein
VTSDAFLARFAPDGTLDPAFGIAGQVITPIEEGEISDMAITKNGSIVLGGRIGDRFMGSDLLLMRYTQSGALDTSFADNGQARTSVRQTDHMRGLALQPDEKIVAFGFSNVLVRDPLHGDFRHTEGQLVLVRYRPDGSLDSDFGRSGIYTSKKVVPFGNHGDVALQPNGKILAAGFYEHFLARFRSR